MEVFYTETYDDIMAVNDPQLMPRRKKRHGPYCCHDHAVESGFALAHATHFKVEKMYVNPVVIVDWACMHKPNGQQDGSGKL